MRAADHYPLDAVTGGCFVLRRSDIGPGEQMVDLDVDLDALPTYGRLCLSEHAVRAIVAELGWELMPPDLRVAYDATTEALSDALAHIDELTEAMTAMVNMPAVKRAMDVADRIANATKDDISSWVDTLEPAR